MEICKGCVLKVPVPQLLQVVPLVLLVQLVQEVLRVLEDLAVQIVPCSPANLGLQAFQVHLLFPLHPVLRGVPVHQLVPGDQNHPVEVEID